MKKITVKKIWILLCLVGVIVFGYTWICPHKLLKNAELPGSMYIRYFDGKNVYGRELNGKTQKRIANEIKQLSLRRVRKQNIKNMTTTSYGIILYDQKKREYRLTYSNGYWVTNEGKVYKGDYYDFEPYCSKLVCEDNKFYYDGGISMANSNILGEYDLRYYREAEYQTLTNGQKIDVKVVGILNDTIWVKMKNNSAKTYTYGKNYYIQKEVNGTWYDLPDRKGVDDLVGYMIGNNSEFIEKFDMRFYGKLGKGHYRFILGKNEMVTPSAEFTIR